QARGESGELDPRADVFSLGCVLFECITGRPAFVGKHAMAILAKILLEEAPRASELSQEIPEPVDDLVARMLSKEASLRPKDGSELLAAIAGLGIAPRAAAQRRARPKILTGGEQRLLCVVLAGVRPTGLPDDATLPAAVAIERRTSMTRLK